MVRAIFIFLILLHGLIHFMGFAKAFKYADIQALTQPISKAAGVLWVLAAILFIITTMLLLFKKDAWWMLAIPSALISQYLIILSWQDAKFGTIVNVIIIIGIIIGYGIWNFNQMAKQEVSHLLQAASNSTKIITKEDITHLPPVVQRWLERSQIIGKEWIKTVHLHQKGQMRTTPDGAWMPVQAEQYFTTDPPGFVWIADVKMMKILHLSGIDTYYNSKGHMLIKALSLVPVVNASGPETDQGTMLRYLAEMIWFPSAALNYYISWKEIDKKSAKAIMTYGNNTVSGIFYFNSDGDMISFEADRYYDRKEGATLERWYIENTAYGERAGIRMPVASEVTWKLKEGDFTWYKLEISAVDYNDN